MISNFGIVMRKIRDKSNDSLRTCATKLGITAAFLSAMEVGRKSIPSYYPEKIKDIYNLKEEDYIELYNAMVETNNYVTIEIDKMNEAQKETTLVFSRKINNANSELIDKLRKVLEDE